MNVTGLAVMVNRLVIKASAITGLKDVRGSGAKLAPTLTVTNPDLILSSLHQISEVAGSAIAEAYCSVWLNKMTEYGQKKNSQSFKNGRKRKKMHVVDNHKGWNRRNELYAQKGRHNIHEDACVVCRIPRFSRFGGLCHPKNRR